MIFHPATLLLAWGGFVLGLQVMGLFGLAWAALLSLSVSLHFAHKRAFQLLRRSRWLLLSITVLFVLATPGQRLPGMTGDLGITYDGLSMAAEHLLRLLVLLATLALLHERLGTSGMMTGLYSLLRPLAGWQAFREKIVLRLMLVLDYVEATPAAGWRTWLSDKVSTVPISLDLLVQPIRAIDWIALGVLALLSASLVCGLA